MKRRTKLSKAVPAAAAAVCAVLAFAAAPEKLLAAGGELAFLSAAAMMPAEAVDTLLFGSGEVSGAPGTSKLETTAETKEERPDTTAGSTAKASETSSLSITDTPPDIQNLMKEYEKTAADDSKGGGIQESDYHDHSVTDSYLNINVRNVNKTKIDIKAKLEQKIDLNVESKEAPYVLIIHSHTTEAYEILDRGFYAAGYKTRSSSSSTNVSRVGSAVAQEIENAGFAVIHDDTIYDTTYGGSYPNSRAAIKKWIEKYPTIRIVLDLHRDAIQFSNGVKLKPTAVIDGKKAAQIMMISGCMEDGNGVEDFHDWNENLTFAVHLQKTLEDMYHGITRPLYFSPRRYNMNLTHCSLLVEMGSDANTLEEAVYSGRMLGTAIAELLGDSYGEASR